MFTQRYIHSIQINVPASAVWHVLSDLSRLPEWYYPSRRVQLLDTSPLTVGTKFILWIRTAVGLEVRAPGEILQIEPERLLKWRGQSNGIAATARWTLTPRNDRTLLTHEFAGGGWMMLLSTLTGRAPRTAIKRLENLKKFVEGAEGN